MELKVQMVREPRKAVEITKFSVEIVKDFGWKVRYTEDQMTEIKARLTKKIQNSNDWIHILYQSVWERMQSYGPKLERFNPEWLQPTEEVLIAFCQSLREMMGLDQVKVKQKKLPK